MGKMNISISEALTGFQRVVKTLDKREILITSPPGEVVQHGMVKAVSDEGMPRYRNPFSKGRLIIQFAVNFPASGWCTDEAKLKQLEKLLPQKTPVKVESTSKKSPWTRTIPMRDLLAVTTTTCMAKKKKTIRG